MAAGFLHDADGGIQSGLGVALIGAEWHVDDDEGAVDSIDHALRVVDHLVERNRHCGFVASHHVRSRVTDEDDINASAVDEAGERVVV